MEEVGLISQRQTKTLEGIVKPVKKDRVCVCVCVCNSGGSQHLWSIAEEGKQDTGTDWRGEKSGRLVP